MTPASWDFAIGMLLVLLLIGLVWGWIVDHDERRRRRALSPEEVNKRVAKALAQRRSPIDGRKLDDR